MATLLAATFLLQACAAETGPQARICNIIDENEMKTLMEGDYTQEPLIGLPRGSEGCKFTGADQKTINYIIGTADDEEKIRQAYDKAVSIWESGNIPNRKNRRIDDMGSEAFWAYNSVTPQLVVKDKTRLCIITMGHFESDEDTDLFRAKRIGNLLLQNP